MQRPDVGRLSLLELDRIHLKEQAEGHKVRKVLRRGDNVQSNGDHSKVSRVCASGQE